MAGLSEKQEALYRMLTGSRSHIWRPVLVVGAVLTVLGCGAAGYVSQRHVYELNGGGRIETVVLYPGTVEQAAAEAGLDNLAVTQTREDGWTTYVTLAPQKQASVRIGNSLYVLPFISGTVGELLESANIQVGRDDIVKPALDMYLLENDVEISIVQVTRRAEQETVKIPYSIQVRENAQMEAGQTRVVQTGQSGERLVTYDIELHDGLESVRTVKSEREISKSVPQIVEKGTKVMSAANKVTQANIEVERARQNEALLALQAMQNASDSTGSIAAAGPLLPGEEGLTTEGRERVWSEPCAAIADVDTLTTTNGETYTYNAVVDVKATAYNRIEEGGLITATGTTTQYGTVAVDPTVIPLGTRIYVVAQDGSWSYGPALAEDTGGLIKGNRIDLYFMTSAESYNFGVRGAKVYILN